MINLQGSIVAVVTPLKSDDTIDFQSFENLLDFHLNHGTNGIVVAGTTGEGYALEPGELRDLVTCAVRFVKKRVPVIAGTGTLVTKKTIELSRIAEAAGADGLLLINPYYNKPSDEFLLQHFHDVATSVAIPIILYNVPGRTGFNMGVDLVLELAARHRNIIGIKEASGNIEQIAAMIERAPKGFKVFSGDDALAYSTIALGGHGCISVAANLIPQAFSDLCRAALSGDLDTAQQLHQRYETLFSANFTETNPVPVKTALAHYGWCQNIFRAPFYPWKNEDKMNQYFSILEKCGVETDQLILQAS